MLDHKLTIFYHTAKHLNTTKAAEILRLSQPAISKSIKELEKGLGITLFDREKGRLMLTPAGKYLLEQSEELIERERIITFNLQHMKKEFSGTLHIGASTTLSQYILPEYLARFRETHPYIEINLISGNTYQIEQELLDKNIQLAFIEGVPSQTDIHYIPFLKDEIVLVTSAKNDSPESITKEQLKTLKFVVREEGSGTYNIIQRQLSAAGMSINELNQQIVIGSTEGIKQYLKHSDCYALVSVFSIQDELSCGLLKIIDIDDLEITRSLYAIHKQGTIDPYAELLLRFCESRNRKSKRKT
jgi:transcriptional regulator, lysR family